MKEVGKKSFYSEVLISGTKVSNSQTHTQYTLLCSIYVCVCHTHTDVCSIYMHVCVSDCVSSCVQVCVGDFVSVCPESESEAVYIAQVVSLWEDHPLQPPPQAIPCPVVLPLL